MTDRKCPICAKPAEPGFKPFCSKRCADVDLSRWFKGSYAIPGAPAGQPSPSNSSESDPGED